MAIPAPPPLEHESGLGMLIGDLRQQRSAEAPYPPGDTSFSMKRTLQFSNDPLPILLGAYERYGPVFTIRVFHALIVFALGPEANHYILVSGASNFIWRESHYHDLTALMGDGLLTTDGEFHRRSRMIMMPAFHRGRIAASIDVMQQEVDQAVERLTVGTRMDLYFWTRRLALRVAMRALFGLDLSSPTARARQIDAASLFEQALSFYSSPYPVRMIPGPGTPWARLVSASRRLNRMIYEEIRERRQTGRRGEDIMSLLLDAQDEEGAALSDSQIRDETMTLLFAGHDTTTSTVSFMFHEIARHDEVAEALVAEQDRIGAAGRPTAEQLMGGELPQLGMAMDETLRMYPPAWIGPRRSIAPVEIAGVNVPAGAYVDYSSWASHHLPDVFEDPEEFRPQRFSPEAKAALPRGAYIPFGGGSRMCIGMRFGQLEIGVIASAILSRFSVEVPEDFKLTIRQMPTISPRHGLPVTLRERASAAMPIAA